MKDSLIVNEIYASLQGESTWAGLPCIFIRLTACNLRCSYCDTAYAFTEGQPMPLSDVLDRVNELAKVYPRQESRMRLPIVELTGGEPLAQPNSRPLMAQLCDAGYEVLLETNGALDISTVDPRVHRIMDLKCPSSGEAERNRWENIPCLKASDEVKFVIGSHEDYEWAKHILREHSLAYRCPVLFSWATPLAPKQQSTLLKSFPAHHRLISRLELAERIIADALPVRFQVQMHKVIWPVETRGV